MSEKDNVVGYCRRMSFGIVVNRLMGLAELDHCYAQGILDTIKTLLGSADPIAPNWWQNKISAFRADGASANMGAWEHGNMGASVNKEESVIF